MNHYIYKIENTNTTQFYIGVRSCKCEIEEDPYMGSSSLWNKEYKQDNKEFLVKYILDVLDTRVLANQQEVNILKQYEKDIFCINILYDRIPSALGKIQTQDHIDKRKCFSQNNGMYGKHHSDETKKILSDKLKGIPKSDETKAKMKANNANKGKIMSEEIKAKLSNSHKKKYKSGYKQPYTKPIIVEDLINKTITEYISNTDFCDKFGFDKQGIGVFIRKGYTYKKQFKIKYKESL